jgi:hypothetical protein
MMRDGAQDERPNLGQPGPAAKALDGTVMHDKEKAYGSIL